MTEAELNRLVWRTKYAERRKAGWKRAWSGPGGTKPKPSAARRAIEEMRARRAK